MKIIVKVLMTFAFLLGVMAHFTYSRAFSETHSNQWDLPIYCPKCGGYHLVGGCPKQ